MTYIFTYLCILNIKVMIRGKCLELSKTIKFRYLDSPLKLAVFFLFIYFFYLVVVVAFYSFKYKKERHGD